MAKIYVIVWSNSAGELDRRRVFIPEGCREEGDHITAALISMLMEGSVAAGDKIVVEEV